MLELQAYLVKVLFLLVYKHVANFAQGVESEHASDRVKKNMSSAKQRVFWASGEQTCQIWVCVWGNSSSRSWRALNNTPESRYDGSFWWSNTIPVQAVNYAKIYENRKRTWHLDEIWIVNSCITKELCFKITLFRQIQGNNFAYLSLVPGTSYKSNL